MWFCTVSGATGHCGPLLPGNGFVILFVHDGIGSSQGSHLHKTAQTISCFQRDLRYGSPRNHIFQVSAILISTFTKRPAFSYPQIMFPRNALQGKCVKVNVLGQIIDLLTGCGLIDVCYVPMTVART
jgi:hypothetical protein